MKKYTLSKALFIKINLIFLSCFLVIYPTLLLRLPTSPSYKNGAARDCYSPHDYRHKVDIGYKMDAIELTSYKSKRQMIMKREIPSFLNRSGFRLMGMVNMKGEDLSDWNMIGKIIRVTFDKISNFVKWKDLFPEWIEEETINGTSSCPRIPMPDFENYEELDVVVVKIPCKYPAEDWGRDVFRLQLHLVAANLAVRKGRKNSNGKPKLIILSKCRPMIEIFRCDDLIVHEGDWWYYEPEMKRLEQKVNLPVGTCSLALPVGGKGIHEVYRLYDIKNMRKTTKSTKREAYATVLHSSESYVCGAIMLAQSLIKTGTKRHLILLTDASTSVARRRTLAAAGWTIRIISRIRNPRATKNAYNEYNYSKLRLWQLTDYDKIIFIDSDIIVLRNLDLLFTFPQMAAVSNDFSKFNSGIMVIEPSKCTFMLIMQHSNEIISYNGGDQGFLNEIFVYWHRLSTRVNFLKNFRWNTTKAYAMKSELFEADPPRVYAIHYLGIKPWLCYRDYDCNWDKEDQHVYASDVAHRRWWRFHDSVNKRFQKHCRLTKQRNRELQWNRMQANKTGLADEHWKIKVTDPRSRNCQ